MEFAEKQARMQEVEGVFTSRTRMFTMCQEPVPTALRRVATRIADTRP